jgi:Putative addiction module component
MTTPNQPNGATAATADRSIELIDRLLKLPEQVRIDLAHLLLDSVREGFTSLKEVEQCDKELIRSRLDQLVKGEVQLLDAEEMFARMRQRVAEVRKK